MMKPLLLLSLLNSALSANQVLVAIDVYWEGSGPPAPVKGVDLTKNDDRINLFRVTGETAQFTQFKSKILPSLGIGSDGVVNISIVPESLNAYFELQNTVNPSEWKISVKNNSQKQIFRVRCYDEITYYGDLIARARAILAAVRQASGAERASLITKFFALLDKAHEVRNITDNSYLITYTEGIIELVESESFTDESHDRVKDWMGVACLAQLAEHSDSARTNLSRVLDACSEAKDGKWRENGANLAPKILEMKLFPLPGIGSIWKSLADHHEDATAFNLSISILREIVNVDADNLGHSEWFRRGATSLTQLKKSGAVEEGQLEALQALIEQRTTRTSGREKIFLTKLSEEISSIKPAP